MKRIEVKVPHNIGDPNYHHVLVPCYVVFEKDRVWIEAYNNDYSLLTTIPTTEPVEYLS